MGFKWFDSFSWFVGFFAVLFYSLLLSVGSCYVDEYWGLTVSEVFCFDVVSVYLVILSVLLCVSLSFFAVSMSGFSLVMLLVSIFSSILCYCCVHSFWFWCFYEISILSLLVLVIVESPYSERYVASWYLLGYVVLSSLPMLLSFVYLSVKFGSFNFYFWSLSDMWGDYSFEILLLLSVLFISKIPLFPFHVWLPLVHAEATWPVSICLSGYVMKLGLLGLCRVCYSVLPGVVFGVFYLVVCLAMAVLFFVSAVVELDCKRWLAFMSLAHIVIPCVCLGVFESDEISLALLYCLGHGLSAGAMFMFLWISCELVGSRNWLMLKSVISSGVVFTSLFLSSFFLVMSIPPTVQFFCEIAAVTESLLISNLLFLFLGIYLFMSGLVPLFLLGMLLTRHIELRCCSGGVLSKIVPLVFLLIWSFLLVMVV